MWRGLRAPLGNLEHVFTACSNERRIREIGSRARPIRRSEQVKVSQVANLQGVEFDPPRYLLVTFKHGKFAR
jgi:hypothetical protein